MAENSNLTTKEKRFTELQRANQRQQTANQRQQTPRPKIQRVAHYLRSRKHFAKHYSPKLVSIGPIHHGSPELQLGEQYKLTWASKYVESTGQPPQILHEKIQNNIKELKDLFTNDIFSMDQFNDDAIRSRDFKDLDEMLSWMLFVDGCSLLHILEYAKLDQEGAMNVKVDQLVLVMQDVLLLENQLPYNVLKLLWRDEEAELIKKMIKFLRCHHWYSDNADKKHQDPTKKEDLPPKEIIVILHDESPTHLLDLQRRIILRPKEDDQENQNQNESKDDNDMITYRNIQELKAAGIRLKACKSSRSPRDIRFSCGWLAAELQLPEIVVDDTTAATVLNLIAYEMCPDFENDYGICSFVAFLDSLIDHPEDVKALRSEGILLNSLGSDKEVARLFNTISADVVPDTAKYSHVRAQIKKHYRNKCKTWIALGCHTYFSNPWAIIAFNAAVLALVLTFIQTWFAIHPAKS